MRRFAIASAVATGALLFAAPGATGADAPNPKARVAFQACAACHSDKADVTRARGPASPASSASRRAGERLSLFPALAKAKLRWDRKTLDAFIANPKAVVPGNRMSYPGVSDPPSAPRSSTYAGLRRHRPNRQRDERDRIG